MKLLTILVLSSNRYDLLEATVHSLLATMTYPHWEMVIYNHDESIGKGWNELMKRINGEYILWCQDDWYFIEKWDWVGLAMRILEEDKKVGIVRLRKDGDGQVKEEIIERKEIWHNRLQGYNIVSCINGGFTMNPFVARAETLLGLGEADEGKTKGVAEVSLQKEYRDKFKTVKLDNPAEGAAIHIGRGRRVC